jgi:hypothetical protein
MLKTLKHARLDNSYEAELRKLLAPDLLIIDDFALDSMDAVESRDAHEIITERHRSGSMILTSNRGPDEWLAMFAIRCACKAPSIDSPATLTISSSKANRIDSGSSRARSNLGRARVSALQTPPRPNCPRMDNGSAPRSHCRRSRRDRGEWF